MNAQNESLMAASLYERIYALVELIPKGEVATYGFLASMVGECSARQVGYAMAATPEALALPWHRVINRQGKVSVRAAGEGDSKQRRLLEDEGIAFDKSGKLDFAKHGWYGPDWEWLQENGYQHIPPPYFG